MTDEYFGQFKHNPRKRKQPPAHSAPFRPPTSVWIWDLVLAYLDPGDRWSLTHSDWRALLEAKLYQITADCSEQQRACVFRACFGDKGLLVEGGQGTGKSFIIDRICKMMRWMQDRVEVTAPTGVAAVNCGGATMHSAMRLFSLINMWDAAARRPKAHSRAAFERKPFFDGAKLLIIDEISMVDPVIAELVHWKLRQKRVRLLVLGDFKQLPPVKCLSDRLYFFQSDVMQHCEYERLRKNYRQNGNAAFLELIELIGDYKFDDPRLWKFFGERNAAFKELSLEQREDILHLYHDNNRVDLWNAKCFARISGPSVVFELKLRHLEFVRLDDPNCQPDYCFSISNSVRETILKVFAQQRIQDKVEVKAGMRFMIVRNLMGYPVYESRYALESKETIDLANGTTGVVLEVDPGGILVKARGRVFYMQPVQLRIEYERDDEMQRFASATGFPIVLSYATTIHKAQGLTLERACVALRGLHDPALAYVAISRVRTPEGLFLIDYGEPRNGPPQCLLDFHSQHH